jgi:uncharacterized membrane protein
VVNRPHEEVFDYFANVENVPEWADNIKPELFTTDGGLLSVLKDENARWRELIAGLSEAQITTPQLQQFFHH